MARFQEEKVTHADMNKEVGSKYGQDKNSSRSEGGNLPIPPRNRDTWRFIRSIYVCRALWRAGDIGLGKENFKISDNSGDYFITMGIKSIQPA